MEDRTEWGCVGEESRDQELWIATDKLAGAPGHVFYRKLNQLLAEHGFDRFVEETLPSLL